MLSESAHADDPAAFRETELFKKCQALGIIPRSESDLARHNRPQPSKGPDPGELPSKKITKETQNQHLSETAALGLQLRVSNMWCPACAWVIDETLRRHPGILGTSCSFSTDRLYCTYDPVRISPDRIVYMVEDLGYKAAFPGEKSTQEKRVAFIRFAISAFLTINIMMLSFALYSGFFTKLAPDTKFKISWPIFFMASIVLFYGGQTIFKRAFAGFKSAAASMETLIAVGALSAYIYSVFNILSGDIHLYFDTAAMLITLVLLGKILERGAKNKIQQDLENFFSLQPTKVKIVTATHPEGRYVGVGYLRPGDVFWVQGDEIVSADGLIIDGNGTVDEASLTGEATPIAKKPGDRLRSGTRVIRGTFKIKAEGVGEASTLGQMIRIMERALGQKTALEGKTDRLLRWFVPGILILASGTGLICYFVGLSLAQSMVRAVTVMVISCPCALGVAIPLARVAGIAVAGRIGILVRDFSAFEQAQLLNSFVFDKTGTITQGQWELIDIVTFNQLEESQALALAAALERDADHYVAIEIKQRASKKGIQPYKIENITVHENGVSGWVDKTEVKIGSKNFLAEEIAAFDHNFQLDDRLSASEPSLVYMSCDARLAAVFIFGDTIRQHAAVMLKKLQARGYSFAVVSGDGEKTTRDIGRKVGVKFAHGAMLPLDKAKFVEELRLKGHRVAMVGDGVNDAPALAKADLAIAVHSGSHLGKEVADLTLMRADLYQIIDFLDLAKRVNRKVNQNLVCSLIYNILSIPIAMTGLLTPLVAVTAMLLSSLSVTGNTLLLVKKVRG
ncbi:MAG: cation-translocating P-type ATPase [Desulfobacterales bacterium]|jgi:heavy metal translocating P-type ATPase